MPSPTVRLLTAVDIDRMVDHAFGGDVAVAAAEPMTGGGFAAVWSVQLSDGRDLVLKVEPPPAARLLRYEQGLVKAEGDYFRLVRREAAGVPVPDVVAEGSAPAWLFTTRLPGVPLSQLGDEVDTARARQQLGRAVASLHRITGRRWGYTGDRPHARSWPLCFRNMLEALLADAADWAIDLEEVATRIWTALDRANLSFAGPPVLLHFDLWDGNVLVTVTGGAARLSGLVDGERWLWGDPLIDLVSPALFRRIEDEPGQPFLTGYRAATGADPLAQPFALQRLRWYRLYLALLMVVELPSRGSVSAEHAEWTAFLRGQLEQTLADVERVDGAG